MSKRIKSIPVNTIIDDSGSGISIEKNLFKQLNVSGKKFTNTSEERQQPHRHNSHSFFLLERGRIDIEIDFQKYIIKPLSVIYVHPDQVHKTTILKNAMVSSWALNNENLNPDYLKLLEDITPARPLPLKKEIFSIISETICLCLKLQSRNDDTLYQPSLKSYCNTLVALVIAQYAQQLKTKAKRSRFEIITKAFREILERSYITVKQPAAYARQLNISTSYLNECVKSSTGNPVSYYIQQRIILEAKRLLYNTNKSVKEIAVELGYDDYPYFSRLFTKVTGVSAKAFRDKNRD